MTLGDVFKRDKLSAEQENQVRQIIRRIIIGAGVIDTGEGVTIVSPKRGMQLKWVVVRSYDKDTRIITVEEIARNEDNSDTISELLPGTFEAVAPPGQDSSNFDADYVPKIPPTEGDEIFDQGDPPTTYVVHLAMKIKGKWYLQWQNLMPPNLVAVDWTDEQSPSSS